MGLLDDGVPCEEVPKHLVTVLYGVPGVGKTIMAARTANKTALFTNERSHVSLSQFPEISNTVKIYRVDSFDQLTKYVSELYSTDHGFDHAMIDTLDGIVKMKLREQRRKVAFKRGHDDISSLEDYNLLNNHMESFFETLTRIPISVTLTSHDRIPDDKSYAKGDRVVRPSIPFRVFESLNGYANVVGYVQMQKINGELTRVVSTQSNDEHAAKNHLLLKPLTTDDKFVEVIRSWKGI